ncbi:MAG TPA: hypothetical protein VG708_09370 [Mycobacteriales bacterium]|nr:hypothetical protein [Mycobacteriales bacterium]
MDRNDLAALRALAATQDGLVTAPQARRFGVTWCDVERNRRRNDWARLAQGVYLIDVGQYGDELPARIWWRAALLAHGPGSCLAAKTAVRALGLSGLIGWERVIEIATRTGLSRHPRAAVRRCTLDRDGPLVVVRQFAVPDCEVTTVDGLPVRSAPLSVVDAALDCDRPTTLSLLDSALFTGAVSEAELRDAVERAAHRRGIVRLREMLELADARAASPLESRVRLACIDGDVPPDELQYAVRNAGGYVIAIGDLAWHKRRRRPLIAEADGADVHATPAAVYRDRWRGNALVAEACDTVRFTYADALRPPYIVGVIRHALASA